MMRRAFLTTLLALAMPADAQPITGGGSGGGGFQILGQGYPNASVTGVTTEQNVAQIKVPAGSMGPNGELRVTLLLSATNNANAKTVSVRLNATAAAITGGLVAQTGAIVSNAAAQLLTIIRNTGVTNSQTTIQTLATPFGAGTNTVGPIATDTTQDAWVNIGIWPSVGTDTITLLGYTVEVHNG